MKRTPLKRKAPMRRVSQRRRWDSKEFSENTRNRAARKHGFKCARCNGSVEQFHHRQMRSQGGKGTLENCLPLCASCHQTVHANPDWSYRHGFLVKRHDNPKHISVYNNCGLECSKNHSFGH